MLKTKGNALKVHISKMNYSIGFYTGGGNIEDQHKLTKEEQNTKLQKDWYVWSSCCNPETQLLERQEPNIKVIKPKRLRLYFLTSNPFDLPLTCV